MSFQPHNPHREENNLWHTSNSVDRSHNALGYSYSRTGDVSGRNGAHLNGNGSISGFLNTNNAGQERKSSIKDRIGGLMGGSGTTEGDLPLYKDKPRFPGSSRKQGWWSLGVLKGRRKRLGILGFLTFVLVWYLGIFSRGTNDQVVPNVGEEWEERGGVWGWWTKEEVDWKSRRDMVVRAFALSWDDYAKHAWGMDVYSPVSRKSGMIVKTSITGEAGTNGMGWIIVDALDTAMMMNMTARVAQARGWIKTSLDFSMANDGVSVFETTSKILGGLLSAHYLSTTFPTLAAQTDDDTGMKGEDLYIEKAVDLADRLLGAFDTPIGIPLSKVNLNTSAGIPGEGQNGASLAAEIGALQLELKYLSKITGEPLYWERAEKIMKAVDGSRAEDGLIPLTIDSATGESKDTSISLGSRRDIYYESLLKQYLQSGSRESVYTNMWEEALTGIKKNLISLSKDGNFTVLGEKMEGLKGSLSGRMDHSVCSMPGLIALGVTGGQSVHEEKKRLGSNWGKKQEEDLLLAEELLKTCWAMHAVTPTLLAPETTYMELSSPPKQYESTTYSPSTVTFDKADPRTNPSLSIFRPDFTIHPEDAANLQSPYTIKSLYHLYRITSHPRYRHQGWQLFQSFIQYTSVTDTHGTPSGYTSLESVLRDPSLDSSSRKSSITGVNDILIGSHPITDISTLKIDALEPHWLAETLKYFFLLFSDDPTHHHQNTAGGKSKPSPLSKGTNVIQDEWFDLTKVVFNSKGHVFPRFDIEGSKVFKTGWSRDEARGEKKIVEMSSTPNPNTAGNENEDEAAKEAREAAESLERWNSAERKEHQFGDVM